MINEFGESLIVTIVLFLISHLTRDVILSKGKWHDEFERRVLKVMGRCRGVF